MEVDAGPEGVALTMLLPVAISFSQGIASAHRRCPFGLCYRPGYLAPLGCVHLANANKFAHIHHVNQLLGLMTPLLTTPLELLNLTEQPPS